MVFGSTVKQRLEAGEIVHGLWLDIPSPEVIEIGGHLGFEYVVIDAEHCPVDRREAETLVRAAEVTGMLPIVRVPRNDPSLILGYLETGVVGIYVPHITTADEARDAVRAVKFPPVGRRSAGSMRAAAFGLTHSGASWHDESDKHTLVIALVEDREGIDNLGEIANVDGVDVVGIGDGDLAFSLGHRGGRNDPEVVSIVRDAEREIIQAGRVLDAVVTSPEEAAEAISNGARMISVAARNVLSNQLKTYLASINRAG